MQEPSILAETIELPVSELQGFYEELIQTYNALAEVLQDHGIMRGRELAEMSTKHNRAVKAEKSPIGKLFLLNAFIRQQIRHISEALKTRPPASPTEEGKIRQAITKIQLRAMAIVEHVKVIAEGKKEVAFNSCQARAFLAGREGRPPSRRDTIRALRRAEKLCPALICGHTPNDGRQTMRLTARAQDLQVSGLIGEAMDCDRRQRLSMEGARIIFFKEGAF